MTSRFDPTANYILEDERVLLRPLQVDDLQHLLPFAINEPDIWVYSNVSARNEDGMTRYVEAALQARAAGREYPFMVIDKQTGEFAGNTRYYDIQPQLNTLQLGYTWYGEKFRGSGLNKHCKYLLLQFAFEELNMMRVEFRADARNQRSIAAMKSIGCVVEGILRSNMPLEDGGRRDSIVLSILKDEWEHHVKKTLKAKLR